MNAQVLHIIGNDDHESRISIIFENIHPTRHVNFLSTHIKFNFN